MIHDVKERTIHVGAIGVGAFMARQHLPNMLRNPRVRIHVLCDLHPALLAKRAKEFQPVAVTTDAEDVFRDPDVDVVLIGTRSALHARFLIRAAECGKHVFVEKPMTMTYDETRRVLDAVRASRITVGVGFNRRFAPIMVEAKRVFHDRRRGPSNIIYRIMDDHRVRPRYIFDLNDGGGHLLQEGCHIFDILSWFLEEEPVEVYAAGPMETDNVVVVRFADDSLATILCGGKGGLFYPKELMEVFNNYRTVVVDGFYELRYEGPPRGFLRAFSLDGKTGRTVEQEGMTGFYRATFRQRPTQEIRNADEGIACHTLLVDKGHAQAIAAFAQAVASGTPYAADAVAGARATVCALKAYESIRTKRPVLIQPSDYGKDEPT